MPTFVISFATTPFDKVVEAAYYRHEAGWTTFKDAQHKVLHDIPDHAIKSIHRQDSAATGYADGEHIPGRVGETVFHVHYPDQGDAPERIRATAEAVKRGLGA